MSVLVDGKVCNDITEITSTRTCYICGATSEEFNSIDIMISRNVKENTFELSILHEWIRFFKCLLHISYKLPIKNGNLCLNLTEKM